MLPALLLSVVPLLAWGHGGVVQEDDQCLIKVGYLEAHFKIYLPDSRQRTEYCEDLPDTGETLFVMEYLHDRFSEALVEFRIIRNITGMGRFARLSDVASLRDVEAVTVFHKGAAIEPDVFSAVVDLAVPGEYIGIVTATPANSDQRYSAVFPFEVGFTGWGFWPWFASFLVFLAGGLRLLLRRQLVA
jgi:hypothetical protein